MAEFIGTGFKFPIRLNGRGGLSYVSGEQSIEEAVWIILSTPLKSRVMEPEFGCAIHNSLFAPNNANTIANVVHSVQDALVRFEPRIDVLDVRAESHPDSASTLLINIDYRVRANNAMHNLVYPFYINEGIV